jgi:hypothetical protein
MTTLSAPSRPSYSTRARDIFQQQLKSRTEQLLKQFPESSWLESTKTRDENKMRRRQLIRFIAKTVKDGSELDTGDKMMSSPDERVVSQNIYKILKQTFQKQILLKPLEKVVHLVYSDFRLANKLKTKSTSTKFKQQLGAYLKETDDWIQYADSALKPRLGEAFYQFFHDVFIEKRNDVIETIQLQPWKSKLIYLPPIDELNKLTLESILTRYPQVLDELDMSIIQQQATSRNAQATKRQAIKKFVDDFDGISTTLQQLNKVSRKDENQVYINTVKDMVLQHIHGLTSPYFKPIHQTVPPPTQPVKTLSGMNYKKLTEIDVFKDLFKRKSSTTTPTTENIKKLGILYDLFKSMIDMFQENFERKSESVLTFIKDAYVLFSSFDSKSQQRLLQQLLKIQQQQSKLPSTNRVILRALITKPENHKILQWIFFFRNYVATSTDISEASRKVYNQYIYYLIHYLGILSLEEKSFNFDNFDEITRKIVYRIYLDNLDIFHTIR